MYLNNTKKTMKLLLPIFLFFIVSVGLAQRDQHPIDRRHDACHNVISNQSTYGMMECESIAREEWDAEMNIYYTLLLDSLSDESGALLEQAQKAWLEYAKKEYSFSSAFYYTDMEGTMWYVANARRQLNIVRERALELKMYFETYTGVGL